MSLLACHSLIRLIDFGCSSYIYIYMFVVCDQIGWESLFSIPPLQIRAQPFQCVFCLCDIFITCVSVCQLSPLWEIMRVYTDDTRPGATFFPPALKCYPEKTSAGQIEPVVRWDLDYNQLYLTWVTTLTEAHSKETTLRRSGPPYPTIGWKPPPPNNHDTHGMTILYTSKYIMITIKLPECRTVYLKDKIR